MIFGFWTAGILGRGKKFVAEFPMLEFLNPILGIVMNFRSIVMFNSPPDLRLFLITGSHGIVIFLMGYWSLNKFSQKAIEKI